MKGFWNFFKERLKNFPVREKFFLIGDFIENFLLYITLVSKIGLKAYKF